MYSRFYRCPAALAFALALACRTVSAQTAPPPVSPPKDAEGSEVSADESVVDAPAEAVAESDSDAVGNDEAGAPASELALTEQVTALEARLLVLEQASIAADDPAPAAPETPKEGGFTLSGFVQTQYESSQFSEDQLQQGGTPLNRDRFVVRRARLRADQQWRYAALRLEIDGNTLRSPTVGLRRAEASLRLPGPTPEALPYAELIVGLQDIPFGFELPYGARKRVFAERSLASLAFFPGEPDVGASIAGGYGPLRYALAVMNGQPLDERGGGSLLDVNAAKDLVLRVGAELPADDRFEIAGGVSFLEGTGFHPGSDATKNQVRWRDDNEDGVIQTAELGAAPGASATPSENFDRWAVNADLRLGLHTSLGWSRLYGEITLATNLDRGYLVADPIAQSDDSRELGYYAAFVQELTAYALVGFRLDMYQPDSDLLDERQGRSVPNDQSVLTLSPLIGAVLPGVARLTFQYDFIDDAQARDVRGVPVDLRNNQWTLRLQVGL